VRGDLKSPNAELGREDKIKGGNSEKGFKGRGSALKKRRNKGGLWGKETLRKKKRMDTRKEKVKKAAQKGFMLGQKERTGSSSKMLTKKEGKVGGEGGNGNRSSEGS